MIDTCSKLAASDQDVSMVHDDFADDYLGGDDD